MTCPACNYTGDPFGPAAFFIDGDKLEYVNCRRCGAMLLVGRDVEADKLGIPVVHSLGELLALRGAG